MEKNALIVNMNIKTKTTRDNVTDVTLQPNKPRAYLAKNVFL
jgi:hypothetical protein